MSKTRREDIGFLHYAISRVWQAAGASEEHGRCVADAITFGHLQGKLTQGLGVYEVIDLTLELGLLDIEATPDCINEGNNWAVIDGNRSSGYYTLTAMAHKAIEKAQDNAISIVFGGNHNDAGSFAYYVHLAHQKGMVGMASNNSVPLVAPFGGMENKLSCPPFDALFPNGEEPPIWASLMFGEFHDGTISEAVMQNKPMGGKWLIDPETGELTDDPKPYAKQIGDYGRVWTYDCGGALESPRTYAMNMWNEGLSAIINPLGIPSTEISEASKFNDGTASGTSVGGSYYICINPGVFGSLEDVKARSDRYIKEIKATKPRPGHTVRIPGEKGYKHLVENESEVEVLTNHWDSFFVHIAGKYDLTEEILRSEYTAQNNL